MHPGLVQRRRLRTTAFEEVGDHRIQPAGGLDPEDRGVE
jgi:hypothetical protein